MGTCGSTVDILGKMAEPFAKVNPCEGSIASDHPMLLYGVCKGSVDMVSCMVDLGHSICCSADAL